MSPLAQHIVRRWMAGEDRLQSVAAALCSPATRCFEVSAIGELVIELATVSTWAPIDDPRVFLPAAWTWIERKLGPGRHGFLLRVTERGMAATHIWGLSDPWVYLAQEITYMADGSRLKVFVPPQVTDRDDVERACASALPALACLSIINTPAIFRATEHAPHVGLARELGRRKGLRGLQPWSTISLHVSAPAGPNGEVQVLRGGRALHFCRAHLRFRAGKVEWVRQHWRGAAALGITRKSYVVKP